MRADAARDSLLWFGVFGGPGAWTIDELAAFFIHQSYCAGVVDPRLAAFAGVGIYVTLIGVAMAAVTVTAGMAARRAARIVGLDTGRENTDLDRRRFMAHAGVVISAIFLFGIVLRTIAIVFVSPAVCAMGS